jgi:serine/threonine protein kinase
LHSKHRFSEPHIKCIMHQLLSGLHECHQMQLIHRDIKSTFLQLSTLFIASVLMRVSCVLRVVVWSPQAPTF